MWAGVADTWGGEQLNSLLRMYGDLLQQFMLWIYRLIEIVTRQLDLERP